MLDIMKTSGALLANMEDHWSLEQALLRLLVGSGAESRASCSILACLPGAEVEFTMQASLQRLELLAAKPAMKLSPPAVQAGMRFIIAQLKSLDMGVVMDMSPDSTSALVRKSMQQFAFFLSVEAPGEEGEEAVTLKGESAYEFLLKKLKDALGSNADIDPELYEKLQLYFWLAGPLEAEAAALLKCIATAESQSKKRKKGDGPAAGGASDKSSSSTSKPSAALTKKIQAEKKSKGNDLAMRYFD